VNRLANLFGKFSQTYTIVGVPSEEKRAKEKEFSSHRFFFHVAVKLGWIDSPRKFKSEVYRLTKTPRFSNVFEGLNLEEIVGYTPGRMDLSVNFRSSCVSEAFDLAHTIGDIRGVIDTVTWPNFRMLEEGNQIEQT
jgi:hypothetical protein